MTSKLGNDIIVLTIKLGKRFNMEEDENKTTEVTERAETEEAEQGSTEPSREEILAESRKENKNGDERERQYFQKGNSIAFGTALLIASAILIVNVIRDDRYPCEIMLLFCASQAVNSLIISRGMRTKTQKLYLVLGIGFAILSVFFLVGWILQLCGVMV